MRGRLFRPRRQARSRIRVRALHGRTAGLALGPGFPRGRPDPDRALPVAGRKDFGIPNRWLLGRIPLPATLAKGKGGPILDPQGLAGHIAYAAMPSASMLSVIRAARLMPETLPRIQAPTLVFHAVQDRTSDFRGSQILMERLGTEDKTLVAFNRGNHVISLDFPRARLEAETLAWLVSRA
jgi:pimeloyl-ACP methyl ester carboxylesterase